VGDRTPQRFDVVIFEYPVDESQKFIKRVIGLPGETVEIKAGHIYIDGSDTPLDETYLKEDWVVENDGYVFEVPEGCYLMLGDNRNVSLDARFWAEEAVEEGLADTVEDAWDYSFVSEDKILGKALFKYWPHISSLTL
jgi:signal peptidase I